MTRYVIDASGVGSFNDFVVAVNRGLIEKVGGRWTGNLDALRDYLSWPEEPSYELEIMGAGTCATALGHTAQELLASSLLERCHPENVESLQVSLDAAHAGKGPTLFDTLLAIIRAETHVRLILSDLAAERGGEQR